MTSPSPPTKILDRVRKLLALAADARGNAQEIAAAAAEAARLMQEHKLSDDDVTAAADDGSDLVDVPAGSKGFEQTWKFSLVTSTARSFYCEVIGLKVGTRRKVRVVGRRQDVDVAMAVFKFLLEEIERLTAVHALEPRHPLDLAFEGPMKDEERRAFYRSGLAAGVASTLREQARNIKAASEKALVLARKSREEIRGYMNVKFGTSNPVAYHERGADEMADFQRGFEKGKTIDVSGAAKNDSSVDKKPSIN